LQTKIGSKSSIDQAQELRMATESTVRSSDPAALGKTEPPSSERASRTERRSPTARETLATLPEGEPAPLDFEPHDTIPAPPWLDDDASSPHAAP
jgi:hypothetical protein